MINVAIISPNVTVKSVLEQQADTSVIVIDASSLDDVVMQASQHKPDVFVLEHDSDTLNGDILCNFLSKHYPASHSLILVNEEPTFTMLKNTGFKARGYISNEQQSDIDKAVRAVFSGEAWLPRKLVSEMLNRFESSDLYPDKLGL